jgi:hypothetical protein
MGRRQRADNKYLPSAPLLSACYSGNAEERCGEVAFGLLIQAQLEINGARIHPGAGAFFVPTNLEGELTHDNG